MYDQNEVKKLKANHVQIENHVIQILGQKCLNPSVTIEIARTDFDNNNTLQIYENNTLINTCTPPSTGSCSIDYACMNDYILSQIYEVNDTIHIKLISDTPLNSNQGCSGYAFLADITVTCYAPTYSPTVNTVSPSLQPSSLSSSPTEQPSSNPTINPSLQPSSTPSFYPTITPSIQPTTQSLTPTQPPTMMPTANPTVHPSIIPSLPPTVQPTLDPTVLPSNNPTLLPSVDPSSIPTNIPSIQPSYFPTEYITTHVPSTSNAIVIVSNLEITTLNIDIISTLNDNDLIDIVVDSIIESNTNLNTDYLNVDIISRGPSLSGADYEILY